MGRIVEIGSLRERVEILEEPRRSYSGPRLPPTPGRIGRIKHSNGENADIDYETLQKLMKEAEKARSAPRRG